MINFYRFTNIYDLKFLDNETTALWIFLKICMEEQINFLKPQFCWSF